MGSFPREAGGGREGGREREYVTSGVSVGTRREGLRQLLTDVVVVVLQTSGETKVCQFHHLRARDQHIAGSNVPEGGGGKRE